MFELSDGVETLDDAMRRIDVRYRALTHRVLKAYLVHGDLERFADELNLLRLERDLEMFIVEADHGIDIDSFYDDDPDPD